MEPKTTKPTNFLVTPDKSLAVRISDILYCSYEKQTNKYYVTVSAERKEPMSFDVTKESYEFLLKKLDTYSQNFS